MEGRVIRLPNVVTEIAKALYICLLIVIVFLGWTILPNVVIAVRQFFHKREESWRYHPYEMIIRSGDIKDAFGLQLISSMIVLFMLGVLGFAFWRGILDFLMSAPVFVWYAWVGIDVTMFVIGATLEAYYFKIQLLKLC